MKKKKTEDLWPPLCNDCGWRSGEYCHHPKYRSEVFNPWHVSGRGYVNPLCRSIDKCTSKNDEEPIKQFGDLANQIEKLMPNRPLWVLFSVIERKVS